MRNYEFSARTCSRLRRVRIGLPLALGCLSALTFDPARAQEANQAERTGTDGQTYGHSMLGDAFNEGPRQRAYLMAGMPKIVFPVTTKSPQAQRFFEQGVGQLHGYWWLEAERSFRQAAALDPDCAMAYWGMGMARFGNDTNGKQYLKLAMDRRAKASERERLWIESLNAFYQTDPKMKERDKARRQTLIAALRKIVEKYPADLEAKAFLAHDLMETRGQTPDLKQEEIDKLMNAVLAANPMHPIHHYRIHLWDSPGEPAKNAINSAALCGSSSPGTAHMWHMQGHIYTDLHRYTDAAWSQEASARTDHAYMIRDKVMPDQIHNYAHNNQWLVENLEYVGRVHDALDLAKNMLELPRHPDYNTFSRGSASMGRTRLYETLYAFDLWQEALALDAEGYVEPTDTANRQGERLKLLAIAAHSLGQKERGNGYLRELETLIATQQAKRKAGAKEDNSVFDADALNAHLAEAKGYAALAAGDINEARKQFDASKNIPKAREARLRFAIGQTNRAEELAREAVKSGAQRVEPLVVLVDILYRNGKRDEAKQRFAELQQAAGTADITLPFFARLEATSRFGASADWRRPEAPRKDIGPRPPLEKLGPFRWSAPTAPDFALQTPDGRTVRLSDYKKRGKPVVVIFYLGAGCEKCMTQLNAFVPLSRQFEKAGISLLAVSTDTKQQVGMTTPKESKAFPFPIVSDKDRKVFKTYKAYDDFEKMPLHGAFLVDAKGHICWQDIRFEPFFQTQFLLEEAKRLFARDAKKMAQTTSATP